MTIWIKLKVLGQFDRISNVGTRTRWVDGKVVLQDEKGSLPFSIVKGQYMPLPLYNWEDLEECKKKFDPEVFEFFKSRKEAAEACKKEEKLLSMLPAMKLDAKNKRVEEKLRKSRFGQKRASREEIKAEAKRIGLDLPVNLGG